MKKYFEYIGLIIFTGFGFFYTNKVTDLMNNKDPLMIEIKEFASNNNTLCKEGYVTNEGVVLGKNGKEVDYTLTYSNMQGKKFDELDVVYKEVDCKINLSSIKDNYIIKGNESKNMISIFIKINDNSLVKDIVNIFDKNNVKVNLIVNNLNNINEYLGYVKNGHYVLYSGESNKDLKEFKSTLNLENNFCISLYNNSTLDNCFKNNFYVLKTNNIYKDNILYNTKANLEKGEFYVFYENKNTLEEINALIKFVKGKNIDIVNINRLLE